MTTTTAPTARPPQTAIAWADREYIYIEYPVKGGGPPYIVKHRKTIEGLQFAFGILVENPAPASLSTAVDHPAVKHKSTVIAPQAAREEAAALVRRLFPK